MGTFQNQCWGKIELRRIIQFRQEKIQSSEENFWFLIKVYRRTQEEAQRQQCEKMRKQNFELIKGVAEGFYEREQTYKEAVRRRWQIKANSGENKKSKSKSRKRWIKMSAMTQSNDIIGSWL